MTAFHPGDRVFITGEHLLCKGKTGTVTRWHHDGIYTVTIDRHWATSDPGPAVVIKDTEMKHIKKESK